jgi:hypothetical protein
MWRVLWRPSSGVPTRSRSFAAEELALSWARAYVRDAGPTADAFVYNKLVEEERGVDPVPASHRVFWIDGELGVQTWPEASRAENERRSIAALAKARTGEYAGPPWVRSVDRPFHVVPGGK